MAELADIFRVSATKYFEKYGARMLPSHKRAIRDIIRCRTEALGGSVYLCRQCEEFRYSYHSCKNRHCPKCGNAAATAWIAAHHALLLPVPHFLVTVTLPVSRIPSVNHVFPSGDAFRIFAQHSSRGIPCCPADRG